MSAHFTIFTGPPASGKTTESNRLRDDPTYPEFQVVAGHGEPGVVKEIYALLDRGIDVIYETTQSLGEISADLINRADTIEIFKIKSCHD